jgi:hypothetical protein
MNEQKTVVGVFASVDDARAAVRRLHDQGVPAGDISVVANSETGIDSRDVASDVAADAGIGAALGGIGGLLLGFTAILIPGVGPALAAGPRLAAIGGAGVGALAGGLIGALSEAGVPEEEARGYAESIRSGNVMVTVRCAGTDAERARRILDQPAAAEPHHVEGPGAPSECDLRTDDDIPGGDPHRVRSADVTGHNPGGEPMSADEARREYARYGAKNPGQRVWPHTEAYDLGDSLVREEVLESEQDPVGMARRAGRSGGARIYEARRQDEGSA